MKESEKIQLEIEQRLKAMAMDDLDPGQDWDIHRLDVKRARAERMENFESKWLYKFEAVFPVEKRENESFTISTRSHGKIDFFPKSNKILFRIKNQWRTNGLNWMVRHLLKMK